MEEYFANGAAVIAGPVTGGIGSGVPRAVAAIIVPAWNVANPGREV